MDISGPESLDGLRSLLYGLLGQVNAQGEIRAESVDVRAHPFEVTANPVLTGLLLQDLRVAPRQPADPSPDSGESTGWFQSYRWWIIGGSAAVAGGAAAAVLVRKVGDHGTITVGPIP